MNKKLYVGGLPWSTTDQELQELFAQKGNVVSAQVITDKVSGRSRGFGFVEMATDDDAKKAIDELNGSAIGDRKIIVNEARPRREDGNGGGAPGGGPGAGFSR